MTDRHFIYYKSRFLKWVLAITLFLSLWTLPGYARKSKIHESAKSQKELILSVRKTNKSFVSYKKAYSLICLKSIHVELYQNSFTAVILVHNALARNTIQHVSEKLFSVIPFRGFQQMKTIPQNSNEDHSAIFLRG